MTKTHLQENETEYVPIGEIELGMQWARRDDAHSRLLQRQKLKMVRVSAVAHIYGNVGVISGVEVSERRFDRGNLYLFGLLVQAGF